MKKLRPLLAGLLLAAPLATAAPRMISFEYPNCYSCHVAVQGRGLLNARGRGIDIEQSYSELDATAALLGALENPEFNDGSWDGNFGPVLADFVATGRYTHLLDGSKDDTTLAALYRQIIFFGSDKKVRINTELGFLHPAGKREDLGKFTHEGRYRVWKEIWMLNYLGRSARYE